ncbi:MAG TPA: NAD(P)H-quinone oxidoreductase [Gemmatimonadaceae bacterium]|nr:NAD(P)H-quinone oxidoreductase [Gemmatimonadaceae bacterium]
MIEIQTSAPGGPEVLEPHEAPKPRAAPGEVVIRVEAAGVNRPDTFQRMGRYAPPPGASPIIGLEVAGEVAELGAGVDGFVVGDRVCALTNGGGYAEYCAVPAGQTLHIPAGMDAVHAAAIPETYFTVWANLFEMGGARRGDTVLVHGGTSGIGTTALMLCREFGVGALATARSAEKCAAIRELGGEAINYREQDFVEVVRERTDGRGADVILDMVGASYFARNIAALAMDGRLVIIAFLGGARVKEAELNTIVAKRAVVTGSLLRPRTSAEKAAIADALRERVWPVLTAGRCWPVIDSVYPLERVADAHRRMESGEHIGKIVLKVSE